MAAGIQIGSTFAGYSIEGVLGRGGMGVVYVAEQPELGRKVAIKVIAPELASDPDYLRRFEHESRLAAAIEHPNAIPIYEAGVAEGEIPYLVMRYVDGEDLATLMRREGRLDCARAARIVEQVSGALDEAHARGLVHRDVKPGNVIVEQRRGGEQAYLTDFGLTKQMDATSGVTATGRWVGTIDYASPEQIKGKQVDARSDVYSLGCVMFVALTGKLPFERDADVAKLYAHVNDAAPAPSGCAPGVAPELDPVVSRALAKDPEERYPSAGDLGRAALAALSGAAIREPERTVATGEAAPAAPQDTPVREAPTAATVGSAAPLGAPTEPGAPPTGAMPSASTVAAEQAPPPTRPSAHRPARGGAGRWVAGIAGLAILAGLVALGVTQFGGRGDGNGSSKGGAFETFSGAESFTVDVPKGWDPAPNQVEHQLQEGIYKTELVSPQGDGNVQIVQEPATPPSERVDKALSKRSAEPGYKFLAQEPRQLGDRETVFFSYLTDEAGIGAATVVNYAFVDGSGWRTRAAIAGTDDKSATRARAIATEMASTLQPR
jgi:serine/threonine-protein kinase